MKQVVFDSVSAKNVSAASSIFRRARCRILFHCACAGSNFPPVGLSAQDRTGRRALSSDPMVAEWVENFMHCE
jgi:hypothetical protein